MKNEDAAWCKTNQTDFERMAVEVKDSSRFPDKWAYFGFGPDTKTAEANPKAACWQCHEDHAAVEHTFVLLSDAEADCGEIRNLPQESRKRYTLASTQISPSTADP